MKEKVYNQKNKAVGEVDLPDNIFGAKWNPELVHQVLVAQMSNKRHPWAHAKDRSEIRGGGRKPWRQKGTGRARHGSNRSPIWSGGGVTHGPNRDRDYSKSINKKMKRLALFSILSKQLSDGNIRFFDSWKLEEPKTKQLFGILRGILTIPSKNKKVDLLFISGNSSDNLERAASNLVKTKVLSSKSLNVYDILNYKNIFIESDAVEIISSHYKT